MTGLKYKLNRQYMPFLLSRLILQLFLFATSVFHFSSFSQSLEVIGHLANIIGKAEIMRAGKTLPAEKNMPIYETDDLITYDKTALKILFNDGSNLMAFQDAKIKISEYKIKAKDNDSSDLKSAIEVVKGKVRFFVKPQDEGNTDAKFKTSNSVMGIRGTSGFIDASSEGNTQIVVTTGTVEVTSLANPTKSVVVSENRFTEVVGNRPPTQPKVVPPILLNRLNAEAASVDPNYKNSEKPAPKPEGAPKKKNENPTSGSNESTPAPSEKKQVFNPDGTSTVISTNSSLNDLLVSQGNTQIRPKNFNDFDPIKNALQEVNSLTDQINRQINTIIDTSAGFQKTKNINIIVNNPQLQ